jgi:hypothetical protein
MDPFFIGAKCRRVFIDGMKKKKLLAGIKMAKTLAGGGS